MRWLLWWQILIALQARSFAQLASPTICQEEACRCDSFTRVICNCTTGYEEVTLRPDGAYRVPSTTTAIIIDKCARVYFLEETVRLLIQLRSVELRSIQQIYIKERGLAWSPFSRENEANPGIKIVIHNSTVKEISSYAIQGRIDDIVISESRINTLKSYAFSSLKNVQNIELTNNIYDNIEIQAFKKFTTVNFLLRGGVVRRFVSRFLSNVEVTNLFRIDGVHIDYLSSLTFLVNAPKRVLIENNVIQLIEGDTFHIVTRGPVTFRNNTVISLRKGAFLGITVDPEVSSIMGPQELLIDNNTMMEVLPSSLLFNITTLTLRVDGLNLNNSCTCELAEEWRDGLKEQIGSINCWYVLESHFVSLPTFMDNRCGAFKRNFWIFIVIGILIVITVAAIVTFYIVRKENEKKKKLQIVMPDGKTYRETEFHIVVERAELLTTDL